MEAIIRRIDLNLLYVLRELLKEPNTTKVGEKLNLTQSAVSASLGRLRWAFQDELFVRSGRAMVPTRRAEGLLEPVEEIIQRIESLVEEVHFEPEKLRRHFTVATTDFLLQRAAGPIIARIHPVAPSTRVIFTQIAADTRDRIRSGHLDLMIAPFIGTFRELEQVSFQTLYTDHLIVAVWAGSKKYDDAITERQLLEATHLEFNPGMSGGLKSSTQTFLEEQGLRLESVAEFTTLTTLLYALRHSDVISIMPAKVVEALGADADVKALELPYDMPEFEVGLMWNRAFENEPEHLWFRTMVEHALADL